MLVAGFRALGVQAGDHVVAHTALSSFGQVTGGPNAVIAALLDVLGPAGTLMVPTATWRSCYVRAPGWPVPAGVVPYDPATTPCDADMGIVPETLRGRTGALRSPHPLISVAAVGALAPALTGEHPIDDPLRPYRVLAAHGGRILLLGVDHTRNTTVHAAEFMAALPHISGPGYGLVRDPQVAGGARIECIPREPDCSLGFSVLDEQVPRHEQLIGGCCAWLLEGQQVLDHTLTLLRANPGALLCDHPSCRTCTRGRRMYGLA
ncbi:MAG TPA: AAC(3) family N-acetyltransferase [Chloroflexia bacterium]|nr:AAC(3) family N-acetyltransferase [Chloroflexia bacterium]